jgi:hypothetical protein
MLRLLIFIAGFCPFLIIHSQPPLAWAKKITGPYGNDSRLLETDKAGCIYIFGNFEDTLYLSSSNPSAYLFSPDNICYLLKCDPSGNAIWALSIGGHSGVITGNPVMDLDSSGNLFIAGGFSGLIDFDPGPGSFTLSTSMGTDKNFLLKIDPSGNFLWAKEFSGYNGGACSFKSIFVDHMQSLWLCGKFNGIYDFEPGPGIFYMTTPCSQSGGCIDNGFVEKLSNNGAFRWAGSFMAPLNGGGGSSYVSDVTVDSLGNGYMVGGGTANTDFNPGQGVYTCSATCGFLCKLDSAGGFIMAKYFYGKCYPSSIVLSNGLVICGEGNNVGTAGVNSIDLDPGPGQFSFTPVGGDGFVLKLDNGGNFLWAKLFTAAGNAWYFGSLQLRKSKSSDIYFFFTHIGTIDFDPGPGTRYISSHTTYYGRPDNGSACYDSSGVFKWAYSFGPCTQYFGGNVTKYNEIIASGVFLDTVDFDPSPAQYTIVPRSQTGAIYIIKLSQCSSGMGPNISISSSPPVICKGESALLTANSPGQVYWSHNLASSLSLVVSPTVTTVYVATGMDPGTGCSNTSKMELSVNDCTGLRKQNSQLGQFPNPTDGIINFGAASGSRIFVSDQYGRVIMEQKAPANAKMVLDLSTFEKGVYLVSVKEGDQLLTYKVLLK